MHKKKLADRLRSRKYVNLQIQFHGEFIAALSAFLKKKSTKMQTIIERQRHERIQKCE